MADINKIREAVKVLSTLSDDEWWRIEQLISNQAKLKEETQVEKKQISYDEQERIVTELLKQVGVPSHIKGYAYTRKAIILIMENREKYTSSVTKVLYPTIAQEYNTTTSRVERAIRHAVEIAWERGNIEIQNKIFGYSLSPKRGNPTNSEFLACIADYVKLYML